jgi:hypothetical protein
LANIYSSVGDPRRQGAPTPRRQGAGGRELDDNCSANAAVHTLEQRPVYRPKDDVKGLLIKASLASVTIDQDRIAVTFSIRQLALSVLFGILCLLSGIVVIFILLAYPLLDFAIIALLVGPK